MSTAVDRYARLCEAVRHGDPATVDLEGAPSRAAVGVLLESRSDDVYLLFIHRAVHEGDPWSGHMAFPGGFKEQIDTNLRAAVEREVLEEVGIDLDRSAELVGRLDDVQGVARGRELSLVITPFVFGLRERVDPRPNEEVQSIVWVPVSFLADPASRGTIDYARSDEDGEVVRLPAIVYRGHTIWGLTLRMVENFLEITRAVAIAGSRK